MTTKIRAMGWSRLSLILAAAIGTTILAGGAVAAQSAAGQPAAAAVPAIDAAVPAALTRAAVLARTIHADLTLWTKNGAQTVRYARGEITALGGDSLTVTARDGMTFTFAVTSQTRVRSHGQSIPFSSLEQGETAMVFATRQADGSWRAFLIRCVREAASSGAAAPTAAPSPAG